ncbi:MAG: cation:H+ antiporter [Patescibacteria group bacterium]|nr:cation:H+ antiporter [Patescibacteria group bacterium]
MSLVLNILALLSLFFILGLAADLTVDNIRYIALSLRMKLFALGVILGIATTLPELTVGINAALQDAGSLSVGNIMGGIIVVIGLILGSSLILNKRVETDSNLKPLPQIALLILSPFALGVDGRFGLVDGLIMVLLYVALLFYLYRINRSTLGDGLAIIDKKKVSKSLALSLGGIILVVVISHFIVKLTVGMLDKINISQLLLGVILFSIGTNLPEIMIAFTSWRRKTSELSLSHLISSAFTNILVLGSLAILKPINFTVGPVYYGLVFFVTLIIILFIIFSHTDKSLSRKEGVVLIGVYLLFVITNILLANI